MAKPRSTAVIWPPRVPLAHLAANTWSRGTSYDTGRAPERGGAAFCGVMGGVWNMTMDIYRQLDRRGKVCSRCKEGRRRRSRKTGKASG